MFKKEKYKSGIVIFKTFSLFCDGFSALCLCQKMGKLAIMHLCSVLFSFLFFFFLFVLFTGIT